MTNGNPATATFSTVICNAPCVHDCAIEPESVRILKLLEPEESRGVIEAFPKDSFCSVSEKDAGKHWQERQEFAPLLEPYCFALWILESHTETEFHFWEPILGYTLQEDVFADTVASSRLGLDAALPWIICLTWIVESLDNGEDCEGPGWML